MLPEFPIRADCPWGISLATSQFQGIGTHPPTHTNTDREMLAKSGSIEAL